MTSSGSSERGAEDNRINWSALAPLLIAALLLQISVPLIRIGASYEALDLGLSATALGVISAAYAFLPMLLAVKVGRFIDRAGATAGAPLGAGLIALCGLCLWQIPPSLASLIAFTAILGCAQIFCLASLEMLCVQSAGPNRRNDVIGNMLLVFSIGQAIAPLIVSGVSIAIDGPPGNTLMMASFLTSAALLAATFLAGRRSAPPPRIEGGTATSLGSLIRLKGLPWVILASGLSVAWIDLLLVYLPLLGQERNIDVSVIGLLLAARSGASIVSRIFFSRVVRRVGQLPLIFASMLAAGAGTVLLAFPAPLWVMFLCISCAGFAVGTATAACLAITLDIAPVNARATALSLRLTGNRIGQFAIPLAAGLAAGSAGVGAILVLLGVVLAACGTAVRLSLGKVLDKPGKS